MGKLDSKTDSYFDNEEHFADIWNGFLYKGKQVIKPYDLFEADRIITMNEKSFTKTNISDKSKLWKGKCLRLLILENQSFIDYHMLIRTMNLESSAYYKQWNSLKNKHRKHKDLQGDEFLSGMKKDEKLIPVITLVINFSSQKWDAAKSLYDIIDIENDETVKPFISNYHLNLFDYHDYDNFDMFATELKNIFEVAKYANDKNSMENCLANDSRYSHLDEDTVRIINELSKIKIEIVGGYGNMCKAFEDYKLEGKQEGLLEGQRMILVTLVKDGDITIENAAMRLNITPEEFKNLMDN